MLLKVGLSHRTAPVEVREQIAIPKEQLPEFLDEVVDSAKLSEALVLSTCNRFEVYGALPRGVPANPGNLSAASAAIAEKISARSSREVGRSLMRREGDEALRHLFRVASSLDSLVVGEPQILGQLKDAISTASERGRLGANLGKAMHRALHVGKRVRTETQIGAGQVSISSVAVDLAVQIFGDLRGTTALLVGAGDMAEGAAKLLVKEGARLLVVNRSRDRANRLAAEVGGEPRDWGELNWCLIETDIVIASTSSPTYVITESAIKTARKARRGRNLFLIDIAVPRNVDPAIDSFDGVYLYDIDDLEQQVAESMSGRAVEANKAEAIVDAEVRQYQAKATELSMNPAVVGLRARVRATLTAELERSLSGKLKHLPAADREALTAMVDAATNKICHRPTVRLRALANDPRGREVVDVLTDLFDLPLELAAEASAELGGEGAEAAPAQKGARPRDRTEGAEESS
jgi:glutamyl-tRNA reductase